MVRIQARWLAYLASALLSTGAPAQAPPAVAADPSKGLVKASEGSTEAMARLTGESSSPSRVLDLVVPVFQLPVAAGRNLAVLTEAAVRLHMLRAKGLDPAAAFLAGHSNLLSASQPS